jgi:nicotinate-nucleotide pyrophosphorylase (carboxylating)
VLLDNMSCAELVDSVRVVAGRAIVEASGGITLDTVRRVAETGVDVISVGALTHSAPAFDLSLEVEV